MNGSDSSDIEVTCITQALLYAGLDSQTISTLLEP
jgi:hypothetical protein